MRKLFILIALIFSYKANTQSTNCLSADTAVEGNNYTPYAPFWFTYDADADSYITISSYGKSEVPTTLRIYSDCSWNSSFESKLNVIYTSQDDISFPMKKGESVKIFWDPLDSNEGFDWELTNEPIQSVLEVDSLALVDLYISTKGDDWFRNANWLENNVQSWQGITVQNNRVTEISLGRTNLKGSIPTSIANLSELKVLDLSRNELNGILATELGNLTKLEELNLSTNNLKGNVPVELLNLTSLSQLFLSENNFHSLPDFSSFNFERLRLNNNFFDFADLEPFRDVISYLDNKQRIPGDLSADINSGASHALDYQVGGTQNIYQWFKNGQPIEGANSNIYEIGDASTSDMGSYRLEVSSSLMDVKLISIENQITIDGYEFGDICSLADSLLPGSYEMHEERFWYIINNENNYDIVATADANTNESKDSRITVFNECDGNIIAENDGYRDNSAALASFIIPAGETYYLLLENFGKKGDLDFQYETEKVQYVNEQDSLALVDLYNSTFGESWYSNNNWLTMPVISWSGIKIENGRVKSINLSYNNLTGNLPVSLGDFSELESLKIHNNRIEGTIPNEISELGSLKHFWLKDNNLDGAIPQGMEKLWSLYDVDFSNNNLSDINADLTELSYSYFNIVGNRFEFDDLELNRRLFTDYNEMQRFGEMRSIGIPLGADTILSANAGGTRNTYQWYLDGVEISGATDMTYSVENATSEDFGRYTVIVRNSFLFGLELQGEPTILYENGVEQGDNCSTAIAADWFNISNFSPTWYSYSAQEDTYLLLESDCCDNTRIEVYDACGGNLIASSSNAENGDEFASLRFKAIQGKEYYFLLMNEDSRQIYWYMQEFPSVSVLEADSLALVDLFRATQGQDWFNQSDPTRHWLEGPVSTWYGITLTGNRVTGIDLYTNLLKGQIPESFGDLSALEVLQLQGYSNYLIGNLPQSFTKLENLTVLNIDGNHFTGGLSYLENLNNLRTVGIIDNDFTELLNVSSLSNLTTFNISGNRLQFDDMESIIEKIDKNEYQQNFGESKDIKANVGEEKTIGFELGGNNNQYQWQRNGEDIAGATDNYLVLNNILPKDSGSYQLLAENLVVPGLILESEIIQIDVVGSGKIEQSISFEPLPSKTYSDPEFTLNATASSELTITYQSSDPTIASIDGDKVQINKAGSVVITALQSGNENYNAASNVDQELIINKADQEIQFTSLANKIYGDSEFVLNATVNSNLPISYLSSDTTIASIVEDELMINGAGEVTITAFQSGNENYNAASNVAQELKVEKADQLLSIEPIDDKEITIDSVVVFATVNSDLPLKFSLEGPANIVGSTIILNAELGLIKIFIEQEGNANYKAVRDSISFNVVDNRLTQEIIFTQIEDKSIDSEPFTIEANSTSNLALNFNIVNGPASISENLITLNGLEGEVEIEVTQPGNNHYKPTDTTLTFQAVDFCQIFSGYVVESKKVSCYGESNGILNVVVEGGNPPYSYVWSNGANSAQVKNLKAGFYEVTVIDNSNCSLTISSRVHSPSPMQVKANIATSTGAAGTGLIELEVTGGTPPYTYLWSTGDTHSEIENLTAGIYEVLITDSAGCTNQKAYSVGGITALDSKEIEHFSLSVYPNPVIDIVNIRSNNISMIMLFDAFGQLIRREQVTSSNFKLNIEDLKSGVYFIKGDKGKYHRFVKN